MPVFIPRSPKTPVSDPPKMPVFDLKKLPQGIIIVVEKIQEILKKADSNKDGCFTRDELKKAFKDLGSYCPEWRAYFALNKADIDHDGQISGEEIDILVDYVLDCRSGHYKI